MKTLICSNPPEKISFIHHCLHDWKMSQESSEQLYTILTTEFQGDYPWAELNLLNTVKRLMGCIFTSSLKTSEGNLIDYINQGHLDALTIAFEFNNYRWASTTKYTILLTTEADLREKYETKEEN